MQSQAQDFELKPSNSLKLPRITDEQVAEANTAFSDLAELGWTKQAVEKRLDWPSGELSRLTLGNCSRPIADKRMAELREFYDLGEYGPNFRKGVTKVTETQVAKQAKALPVRAPVSDGVLDELLYAERLRAELEASLTRAEGRCLPLLRLGLRAAINRIRDFRDDIRVG